MNNNQGKMIAIEITKSDKNEVTEKQLQTGSIPPLPAQVITLNVTREMLGKPITLENGAVVQVNADGTFVFLDKGAYDHLAPGESEIAHFQINLSSDAQSMLAVNREFELMAPAAGEEQSEGSSTIVNVDHPDLVGLVESIPRDLGIGPQAEFLTTETFTFIKPDEDGKPIAPLIILPPVFEDNLGNRIIVARDGFSAFAQSSDSDDCECDTSNYPNIVHANIFDAGASFGPDGPGSFGFLESFTRPGVSAELYATLADLYGNPGNISQFYQQPGPGEMVFFQDPAGKFQSIITPEGNSFTLYLADYNGYHYGDVVYNFAHTVLHIPELANYLPGIIIRDEIMKIDPSDYGDSYSANCGCYSCTVDDQFFYDAVMYYIMDVDGDLASNYIMTPIADAEAIAAAQQASINEADIMTVGSNQQNVQAQITGSLIDNITTSFGADGGIVSNVTIEGGTTVIDSANDVIRVTTAEGNVLEVTQSTGQYVYYLNKSIDNDSREGATDTQAFDKFHFQLTDFDFDQAESDFTVVITDDNPIINPGSLNGVSLLVDETNFNVDATANLSVAFEVIPGADGAQSIVYNLSISNANSGLVDTLTGQPVMMTISGGNIIGSAAGNEVFRLTINAATGVVTLNQSRAVVHDDPNNPNEIEPLANNLISYHVTVTDNDQDVRTSSVSIGNLLQFRDDAPTIQVNAGAGSALTVDETNFNVNASGNLGAAKFNINPGADQAASIVYSLVINNINSGLVDSITNEAVMMSVSGNTLIGASLSGGEVFRITINNATGAVTLDQSRPVEHSNPNDPNDVVSIANNLIAIQVVVTDNDLDQASAQTGIGDLMRFLDDAPTVQATAQPLPDLSVDETNFAIDASGSFSSAFTVNPGGDQLASSTYSLVINASNTGFVDTQTGEPILMSMSGSDIVGSSATGGEVFRISVNPNSGLVSLNQSRAMVHGDPNNANEVNTLTNNLISLQLTVVDNDGDPATAAIAIGNRMHFIDDAPVAVNDTIDIESAGFPAYDLMLILDNSGSMAEIPEDGTQSRLETLKAALAGMDGLLDSYADVSSALKITIVLFNNVGQGPFTFSGVNAVLHAKNYINALTAGGGTALDEGMAIAGNYINAYAGSSTAVQRAYLFSDGVPSSGSELTLAEVTAWQNTMSNHDVDMVAINIGGDTTSVSEHLAPLANPSDNPPVIEVDEDLGNLNDLLAGTVPEPVPVTGNLLANDDLSNDLSNVITEIRFAFPSVAEAQDYAAAHPEVSIAGNVIVIPPGVQFNTPNGNHLVVQANGEYTYTYIVDDQSSTEVYTYTLRDGDLDSSTGTFTFNLTVPPPPTLTENQDVYLLDNSESGTVRILKFTQIDTGATGVANTQLIDTIPSTIAGTHGDVTPDGTRLYMVGNHFGYYDLVNNNYVALPDLSFTNSNGPVALGIPAVAFDLAGNLYVADANTNALYTVNLTTGVLTHVVDFDGVTVGGGDLTITDQGSFYLATAAGSGGLYAINPINGNATLINDTSASAPSGLANLDDGSYFISDRATDKLVHIAANGTELGRYDLQIGGVGFDHTSGDLASRTINVVPPVFLDLDGDGKISIIDSSHSQVKMDVNGDGIKDSIDWVSKADGILVFDANHDGQFSGIDEINFTKYAENAYTDLQALAKAFDSNHDGVLDAADNEYNNFYVWQDANQNGMSEAGEMQLLDAAGITSIRLQGSAVFDDVQGSIIIHESSYTMANGQSHMLADTALQYELGKASSTASVTSSDDALAALDSSSAPAAASSPPPALANEPAPVQQQDASVTAALQQAQHEANATM